MTQGVGRPGGDSKTYSARILLDSVSPAGARVTTMEWVYPRFIHSEVMTYRMFSRNTSSSRAIPIMKMIRQVVGNPAYPVWWGKNQSGMQARAELRGWRRWMAERLWYTARWPAVAVALTAYYVGLHKQIANRLLEPWMWITMVVTASPVAFENCFRQRCHPDAQPEFRHLAILARSVYNESIATERTIHPPLILADDDIRTVEDLKRVSTARCARTSYETHLGTRDIAADIALYGRLHLESEDDEVPHTSPAEHVLVAHANPNNRSGNIFGWTQHREEVDPYFIHFEAEEVA